MARAERVNMVSVTVSTNIEVVVSAFISRVFHDYAGFANYRYDEGRVYFNQMVDITILRWKLRPHEEISIAVVEACSNGIDYNRYPPNFVINLYNRDHFDEMHKLGETLGDHFKSDLVNLQKFYL